MNLLILSDIHANLSALTAVLKNAEKYSIQKAVILGDNIDYCMRPNQVIDVLQDFPYEIDVNIWGNHEKAIIDNDLSRFSSDRGRDFSSFTKNILSPDTLNYIHNKMTADGMIVKEYNKKKFLFIHGSLQDPFWKSISVASQLIDHYNEFDYVLSGHSHIPHFFSTFSNHNNQLHKTIFINPGSVGQPRNYNPNSSYAILDCDTGSLFFKSVEYDIAQEQKLFPSNIHEYYKNRLKEGL